MKYTLGLDIGITSIGWAVLDNENERIVDLGVRLFPGAENPKDGASLALPRREARSARRRTRRKRQRMRDLRRLIVESNILKQEEMDTLFDKPSFNLTPWELRVAALDRKLNGQEMARVMLHTAKHRGFKSNRTLSAEEKEAKKTDDGKANASIKANADLFKNSKYRTVGEMIQNDAKFETHKRNKGGDYSNTLSRASLEEEIKAVFARQRELGSTFCDNGTEDKYLEIFNRQLPFASGDIIEKMVGFCTLEPEEKRAPKASWTAERFVLLSKVANLSIRSNGEKYELALEDKQIIERMAYEKNKVTYKQIRAAFPTAKEWVFADLPSKRKNTDKDPEEKTFAELKGFHEFRKAITARLGKEYWESLISTKPQLLDTLAFGLTYRKTDDDIRAYLAERDIDDALIEAVLPLNFAKNVNLSLKAMRKLIPFMEKGLRFDEACIEAGYHHSDFSARDAKSLLLPVLDQEEVRNPVVFRSVTQTRKVVNAVIRKYGSPARIHIELARDLSKSKDDRKEIEKKQQENRNDRERLAKEFEENFSKTPTATELLKYRLFKEQNGRCPYSGKAIDLHRAFMDQDGTYAEIDHIIPYSRSFDDGYLNKVLVIGSENRNKQDRTPFEYLGSDEQKWDEFVVRVDTMFRNRKKADKLKRKDFAEADETEMKERSLGDTRYITRFVSNWLNNALLFSDPEVKRPVMTINGQAIALLRHQWGVNAMKNRGESDLHHALDACIISAANPAMIKRMSDHSRKKELGTLRQETPEGQKTHFPEPWLRFRKEVEARLSENPTEMIKEFGLKNYSEEDLQNIKPIFVSRMPDRKASGAAHQETIRSAKYLDEGKTAVKTPLTSLKKSDLDNMVDKERNQDLYEDLKKRLSEYGDKPDKAFQEPFYRRAKDGKQGPLVKSIKILSSTGTAGVRVRGGIASNGEMVRVDVYQKNGKHFLIPYYVDDIANKYIKSKGIVANKNESEWQTIDATFEFRFSLFQNDLVRIIDRSGKEIFGYYKGTDRSTAAVTVLAHDASTENRGIGVKTAKLFEKYTVDPLGNYYKVKKEKPPHELA